jgi:transposase
MPCSRRSIPSTDATCLRSPLQLAFEHWSPTHRPRRRQSSSTGPPAFADWAERLHLAAAQADDVAEQIRFLARDRYEPLTRLCGVNLLTAGTLAGILGPGRRFEREAQLAACAGTSPLEASSSGLTRHRAQPRQEQETNSVIYRIALTQAHFHPGAKAYLERRVSEGKTRREAHRCLRRFIARAIWRLWQECLQQLITKTVEAA